MLKKGLFIIFCLLFSFSAEARKGVNIFAYSRPVPATAVYNRYGQKTALADFKGDFVLAVFWSRYCVPCIKELDDLNSFVRKTRDSGIRVMIISKDDEWTGAGEQKELLGKYGAPDLDFYVDKDGRLSGDFGIFASPHTVLVNKAGEEFGRISGSLDWDDEDVIEEIYKLKAQYGEGLPSDDE